MATLDLGKIKFVWKGAYDGATTYEADDVVSYQGSSYIYKNATPASGNLPTLATHWDALAQGTDLSSLSTGAVPYKTAGGVAGLTSANAGDLLQSGGTGVAPSYVAPSTVSKKAESVKKLPFHNNKRGYQRGSVITNDNEIHVVGDGAYGCAGTGTYRTHGNYYRSIHLPDKKTADTVFDFRFNKFVITTDNALYGCGYNAVYDLGLGLTFGGGRNSTSAVSATENHGFLTRIEFPTVNYPLTGNSQTPQIVSVFRGDYVYSDIDATYYDHGVTFAVDTLGYLWAWGYNNARSASENPLGLGWGNNGNQGQNGQYCPVRVPTFLPSTVGATAGSIGFSQPAGTAATSTAIKTVKVEFCEPRDGIAALVDPTTMPSYNSNPNLNLFYWGLNGSSMWPGTAGVPTALAKTALGLSATSSDYVRDVIITQTNAAAGASGGGGYGTVYILLNSGRLFTRGYNGHGQCGNGNTTNQTSGYVEVSAPASLTWAVPALWDLSTATSYRNSINALGSTLVVWQGCVYAQLSNGTWKNWGYNPSGNLGRAEADTNSRSTPGDFSLYHYEYPRSGQSTYGNGGSDYGQANILSSTALTTASGTYINRVDIAGGRSSHFVWLTLVTPATNKIEFYSAGYNYYGSCGNINSWYFTPSYDSNSYSYGGVGKSNWNYNHQFRLVPTPSSFTISNILDWDLLGDPRSTTGVARVALATGELYACGYSGSTNTGGANNNRNEGNEYAINNSDGYSGTSGASGWYNASTTYGYFNCQAVPHLTRVALGQ